MLTMVIESDKPEKEGSFCLCLFLAYHVFCKDQNCLETKALRAHTQCVLGITICTLQSTNPGGYLGSRLVHFMESQHLHMGIPGHLKLIMLRLDSISFRFFFFFFSIGSR